MSYEETLQRLRDFGLEVVEGPNIFGGSVTIKLKGESVNLPLSYAKEFSGWIMGVGQKVHNKLED